MIFLKSMYFDQKLIDIDTYYGQWCVQFPINTIGKKIDKY